MAAMVYNTNPNVIGKTPPPPAYNPTYNIGAAPSPVAALSAGVSNPNTYIGGSSNISGIQTPTEWNNSSANKNTERTTNLTGTGNTNTTGAESTNQTRDLQSVTDPILRMMEQAIANAGNQQTLNATDETRRRTMEAIMAAIQGFDAGAIEQGARGDVDALTRQLLEDTLPQVTGAVEASGSSNNALGALLAQDAASRTGEAQARVQEQARANAQAEFMAMIQGATGAAQGGSAVADNLANLLNISKGMVDRGGVSENKIYNQNEKVISTQQEGMKEGVQSVGSETGYNAADAAAANMAGSLASDQNMMAKLALLQSSLSPFQTLQDLTAVTPSGGLGTSRLGSTDAMNRLAVKLGI